MSRQWLKSELSKYQTSFSEEQTYVSRFLDLLFFKNCFERSLLTGHITASAWILSPDLMQVVLLHHKKLNKWLQPGGHADGEEDVLKVAIKEMEEETGITNVSQIGNSFFDLDIHRIPKRNDIPEHNHYDVRFAFVANEPDQLIKNHESLEVAWVSLDQLETVTKNEPSIIRMKEKTRLVHASH